MRYQLVKVAVCSDPNNYYQIGHILSGKYDSINRAYIEKQDLYAVPFHGRIGVLCDCRYEVQEVE